MVDPKLKMGEDSDDEVLVSDNWDDGEWVDTDEKEIEGMDTLPDFASSAQNELQKAVEILNAEMIESFNEGRAEGIKLEDTKGSFSWGGNGSRSEASKHEILSDGVQLDGGAKSSADVSARLGQSVEMGQGSDDDKAEKKLCESVPNEGQVGGDGTVAFVEQEISRLSAKGKPSETLQTTLTEADSDADGALLSRGTEESGLQVGEGKISRMLTKEVVSKRENEPAVTENDTKADVAAGFAFWFLFLLAVSVLTGILVMLTSAASSADRPEWETMPLLVRDHVSRGQTLKVSGADGLPLSLFMRTAGRTSGEFVVCLHGFASSSLIYRDIIPILTTESFRVLALDFPGAGLSEKPLAGIYGTQQLAELFGRVVQALELPPVHLVLHDTAGPIGVAWAANNPDHIRTLTLIDTPMTGDFRPAFPPNLLPHPIVSSVFPLPSLLQYFCAKKMSAESAYSHAFLVKAKGGLDAAKLGLAQSNRTLAFADELRGFAEGVLGAVPRQILWAENWAASWKEEGEDLQGNWPLSDLVFHKGGRWPQEVVPHEIAYRIIHLVKSVEPTVWTPPQEEVPAHIQRQFAAMQGGGGGGQHRHHRSEGSHGGGHSYGAGHSHGGGHSHGPGCSH
eukprot:TRINITY_DN29775_c0_g1_i1.p1 TRINITY_DN29775_c0_g1~~TRINITY_DN29775_c0_g1_i1.p1  ORF type:complete len:622 (-),score=80.32 TRINITY_DN29775_c0_g1_i1:326-2191(-)